MTAYSLSSSTYPPLMRPNQEEALQMLLISHRLLEMRLPYSGMETTDIISEQFLLMAGAFQELLPGIYRRRMVSINVK
jgi:hypothetical protein